MPLELDEREQRRARAMTYTLAAVEKFAGQYADAREASDVLMKVAGSCHLITPVTMIPAFLPLTGLSLTFVLIDPRETYFSRDDRNGPQHAIKKPGLDRIATAAGVSWGKPSVLIEGEHRLALSISCEYTTLDLQRISKTGTYERDLREGSSEFEDEVRSSCAKVAQLKADGKLRQNTDVATTGREWAMKSIGQKRRHITALVDSGASARAIRSLGVRQMYSEEELRRPFAVAQIVFTGVSNDPATQAAVAKGVMDRFLGGAHAAFGRAPIIEATAIREPGNVPHRTIQAPKAPPPERPKTSAAIVPGSGQTIGETHPDKLRDWVTTLKREMEKGTSRWPEADKGLLAALESELAWREATR